jgi:hypothetical protein
VSRGKKGKGLRLDSPHWSLLDAHYHVVCIRAGSPKLAAGDLERQFKDERVPTKLRNDQGERLLDHNYWADHEIIPGKHRFWVRSRDTKLSDPDAAYFVWQPAFEKVWLTTTPTTSAPGSAGAWIEHLFPKGEWHLMTAKDIHGKIVPKAKALNVKAPSYSAVAKELQERQKRQT